MARFGARLAKRLASFRRVISHERLRDLTAPPPNCVTPVKLLLAALRSSLTGGTEGRLFRAVEVWPCYPTTAGMTSGALLTTM